ncbi:MBG domain-containing protein [Algoriphagus halophytocola]|uniref:MBG domain-containing protein n=1 Tax=Algoriphagus halophytocola TaxID=2991499 RepID=UPI0022DE2FD9|nr:MBG domain-containing protein [Algoriphagus sp. TR-M9]WBL41506.1 MBG domain-containing protein [Algoriphagus sp. TR-M9]
MKNLYCFINLKWVPTILIFFFTFQFTFGQAFTETFNQSGPDFVTSFSRTYNGVQIDYLFTPDGDGGDFAHNESGGNLNILSGGITDTNLERVTIRRNDGSPFIFKSIDIDNIGGFNSYHNVKVTGKLSGGLVASQTMNFGDIGTLTFNGSSGITVDLIEITAGNFEAVLVDNFSGVIISANSPPTAASFTAANGPFENLTHTFSTANFGYSDGDGNPLSHILIESVPGAGTLYLDANNSDSFNPGEAVGVGTQVSKANLDAGNLQYIQNGSTDTSFQFEVNDGTVNSSGNYIATLNVTPVPTVTLGVSPTSRQESETTPNVVTATLSNAYGANTTVNLSFSGSAVGIVDYSVSSTSISIPSGNTSGTMNILNVPDALYEGNETVVIDISSVSNGIEDGVQQVTYTIIEDDSPPTATLEVLGVFNPITDESGGQAYVRAKLDAVAGANVSVPLTFSGTATGGGTDYVVTGTRIDIPAGALMDSIRVTSLFDEIEEGDETIIIDMEPPTNAIKGTPNQLTITIQDEDFGPPSGYSVQINQDPILPSNSSNVSFTFTDAEKRSTYNYLFTSSAGGSNVSGSGTISSPDQTVSNVDLSGMADGDITLSVDLTDTLSNTGPTVQYSVRKLASEPPFFTGLPTDISVAEGIASKIDLSGATFGDPDAAVDDLLTITIVALGGTISFNPGVDVYFGHPFPGSWTITGTISNLNSFLSDPSSIKFTSYPGVIGDNAGSIGLAGNDGTVGASFGTINIDVREIPSVTSVSVPANGIYSATQNLNFSVNYSEAVTVSGVPSFEVTVGSTVYDAEYVSGSGSSALLFRYTVQPGDLDTDGISVGGIVSLNGGSIQNSFAVDAELDLNSVGSTAAVLVEAIAPLVTRIERQNPTSNPTNADAVTFRITFSEDVSGVDSGDFSLTGPTGASIGVSGSGFVYDVTVSGGNMASLNELVSLNFAAGQNITDMVGNALVNTAPTETNENEYTLDNNAPAITALSPADNATDVSLNSDFVITFNEDVVANTGNLTVHRVSDDAVVRTFDVTNTALVSISGGVVTFTNTSDLALGTEYYIMLNNGAFQDEAGNAFGGIPNSSVWSFTTSVQTQISIDDPTVSEGNSGSSNLTFTVSLSQPAPVGGATVDFATSDGTATAGSDYIASSGTLSFAVGESNKTVDISITGDEVLEPDETLTLTLSNPTGTNVSITDASGIGTILNDDAAAVTIADVSVIESDGNAIISAVLDHAVQGGFTVDVSSADGTATVADNDYSPIAGQTLTFTGSAGEVQTFQVPITDDSKVEIDETVSLTMNNLSGTSLVIDIIDAATLTISNDDQASVTIADVSGKEDDGAITVTLTLDNAVDGGFDVNVSTADGTATTSDSDYTAVTAQTLTFAGTSGETQTFIVTPTVDAIPESDETVIISMSNLLPTSVAGGDIDISDGATLTILNDDINAPSTPDLVSSSDSGISDSDDLTNDRTPTLRGTADPNITIEIFSSVEGSLGETTSTNSGEWEFTPTSELSPIPGLTAVSHDFTARSKDVSGNFSDSDPLSVVIDSKAPAPVVIGSLTIQLDNNGNAPSISPSDLLASPISDDYSASGDIQLTLDVNSFDCTDVGPNTVRLIATDEAGNSDYAETSVIVEDNIPPTIQAKSSITLNVDAFGTVSLTPSMIEEGSTDACGIQTQLLSQTLFDRTDEGVNNITYTVTDVNGNPAQLNVAVTIVVVPNVLNIVTDPGQSKVYGDADPVFTYSATGFEAGDDETILTGALARAVGENVGTYAINQGTLDAGPNYTINFTPSDFEVTPATLDVTADAGQTKVYGDADPVFTYQVSGYQNGDDSGILSGALARDSGENVGTYAIQPGTIGAGGNYTINFTSADFEITPATLSIAADAGQSKIYGDADPVFTYTVIGLENGDSEAAVVTGSLIRVAGENVGTYAIQPGTIAAGGNYTINFTSADFEITPATLSITANAGQSKVYGDADPVFTYQISGLKNGDTENVLTGELQRAIGENIGTYPINQGTLTAGLNYTINYTGADFTIGEKILTISVDAGQNKVYGDADPVFTYSATGFEAGDDETILTGALSRAAGENVGTYAINQGTLDAGPNYTINFTPADFEITPATLDVTADAGQTKVYGDADPVFTYQVSGYQNGDDSGILSGALARDAGENVGTYSINLGPLNAGPNYTINFTSADFEITPATLSIAADAGQSKVYGDADPVFTYTVIGLENGDSEAAVVTGSLIRVAGENVGTYAIQPGTIAAGGNYTINFTSADFEITSATLSITANAGQSKVYGDADPVFTYQISGLKNGDTENVLTGELQRAIGENIGTYPINQGTLTAGLNYTINYTGADFTIGEKILTISVDAGQNKVYGDADPVFTYSATGFEAGDDETILTGALARAVGENVGTYAINQGTLDAGPNYTINFTPADFEVTPATLDVTADAGQTKVYGDADPVFTYQVNGYQNGDDSGILSGDLARDAGENVGTYSINLGPLNAGPNYTINFTSADFEITPATLSITADAGQSKVYGDADPVFTYTVIGLENGDSEAAVVTGSLIRVAGENVGTYAIQPGTIAAGGNYTINFTSADFEITPATLSITADAGQSKVYGDADPVFTYQVSGYQNGDDVSILSGALARAAGEDVGSYAINVGTLDAGANYTVNFNGAEFSITPRTLNITANPDQAKVYGSADPVYDYTASNFGNGDNTSILSGALSRVPGENVGMYAITLGTLDAGANYTINFTSADFEIAEKVLNVTADPGQGKVFGTSDPILTYQVNGFENGDDAGILTGSLVRAAGENVGSYAISLGTLDAGSNYAINYSGANFAISKATITGLTFTDETFTYDGTEKSLMISGTLPAGTSVTYTNNGRTEVGTQEVTATITGSNYNTLVLTADLTITPAEIVGITFTDESFTYDGTEKSLMISGTLPAGTSVTYTNNGRTEVGTQEVTATITGSNYNTLVLTADLSITPAEIVGITFTDETFTYDGTEKSLMISGTLPAGTSVTYTNNGRTEVGTQEVTATITGSNYNTLVLTADLTITPAEIVGITFTDETFTYDGTEKSLMISGTLPAGTSVTYTNNGRTEVGTQEVTATISGDNITEVVLTADLSITPASLTVVADEGQSKEFGMTDPVFTYSASGFQATDSELILTGALSREAGEEVGSYFITLGSLNAGGNYTIDFTGADFMIVESEDVDSDGDGVPDGVEELQGTDPTDASDYQDTDEDAVPDYVEIEQGTHPEDSGDYLDSDNDQVPDYVEEQQGTDLNDEEDFLDVDEDGIPDYVNERSITEFVPQSLEVLWGTTTEELKLPTEVVVITAQGVFINVPVDWWDLSGYDAMTAGTTAYQGQAELPAGLFNPDELQPVLEITVLAKPEPEDVLLSENSFTAIPDQYFQEIGAFTVIDPAGTEHQLSLPEGVADNDYFEVIDGILFWSSADEASGRTEFTVHLRVEDQAGNVLEKDFAITRSRTPLEQLEIPNTFTPNGDGVNDAWGVSALRYYSGVRISVMDIGGERLFYTEDADMMWDGTYNGKQMPVGSYLYIIEVGETGEIQRGMLNLLRE